MHVSQNFEKQSLQKQAEKRKDQQALPLPLQDDARYIGQGESEKGDVLSVT